MHKYLTLNSFSIFHKNVLYSSQICRARIKILCCCKPFSIRSQNRHSKQLLQKTSCLQSSSDIVIFIVSHGGDGRDQSINRANQCNSGYTLHYYPRPEPTSYYQLLAHFTFRLAISSSSSSLANASTAKIASIGEQARSTLAVVHAYSIASSIVMGSLV
mmetsp:Transcript_23330/g.41815  ORF Transcript_23330/g.41815 Transcript_23330/m.41815 type:complete len:159 (+) Transcript_23330:686-1162(+)